MPVARTATAQGEEITVFKITAKCFTLKIVARDVAKELLARKIVAQHITKELLARFS